jgi:hypothetical protein
MLRLYGRSVLAHALIKIKEVKNRKEAINLEIKNYNKDKEIAEKILIEENIIPSKNKSLSTQKILNI